MCTRPDSRQAGASLVELIIFIVIIGIAVAGVLLVMNRTTAHSADALLRKQALAAAESLLEEIELHDFSAQSGVANAAVTQANRANAYHIVSDYDGFATAGIFAPDGVAPVAGLESYNVSVAVANSAYAGIAAASAVRITVTVTDPFGNAVNAVGYRTDY